jgi:hypothetical protein
MDTVTDTNEIITDKDFFEYPTIEAFRAKLEELRNIDFTNTDKKTIGETIFSYLTVVPSLIGKYAPEKFNQFKFYRVRLNVNDETEDLNLIRTYSYPSPQLCKENGRANLQYKSVFYSTNSALTAIIESKPKVGDIGYLNFWEGSPDREMKSGVLLPRDLNTENEWYVLAKDIYAFVDKHFDKVGLHKSNYFHEALNFISKLFLTEKPPYPITSWISTELLYGSAWKDFIIYPSFANKAFTSNFAIHPNVADKYLKFVKVIRFKVLSINEDRFSVSTGRVGEMMQNNIEWRAVTKDELDFSLFPS